MAKIDLTHGDTDLILDECHDKGVLRNQAAYVLATTRHETAYTMKPIKEYGGNKYFFDMYDKDGDRPDVAKRLGNTKSGDGVKFPGRGYVMMTGRENYTNAKETYGIDFVGNPDLAMVSESAVQILVGGMISGTFTTKKLSDYITLQNSDFVNARRIINGTDKAQQIADIAVEYDALLLDDGYGVDEPDAIFSPPPPPDVPTAVTPPKKSFWERFF